MDIRDDIEVGTIERELYIEASPETVFQVISTPEYIAQWWPDTADYELAVGGTGEITFGDCHEGGNTEGFTVMELDAPTTFSFRWTHRPGTAADADNSLFVTFSLSPSGTGTTVHFTETGFRERGWEAAVLEENFTDHAGGWTHFLPRLVALAEQIEARA